MFVNVKNYSKALRNNQSGAALVTALLVATLLLMVGGALVVTTNLAALLSVDSTSESQAYYCAEAGINNALNVLRGNIAGSTSATFRNAATNSTLSPWLTYNSTIDGKSVISLSSNPQMGYTVAVTDPDNTPIADQPDRLLVRVTGYGPKGSKRQMEVMVNRFLFDFNPIATILVRGNDNNTSTMTGFAIGNSNAKEYSGYDHAHPSQSIPAFGTTQAKDYALALDVVNNSKPNTVSGVDKVKQFDISSLPSFLESADNARDFLTSLQATATGMDRYFTSTPSDFGSSANPQFTFVDGDCSLGDGAGLLVVTGKLTASGNVGFNGIILVLGEGVFQRNGGGNGDTYGAIVVAKFARTWPSSENGQDHPFLSATYDMNGGGNSTTGFDSAEVEKALNAAGLRNMGIREY
jgi:hypothetical protein